MVVYTDAKTRAFEKSLAWAGKAAMKGQKPLLGPLVVAVEAIFGVPPSWPLSKRDKALAGVLRHVSAPDADNCGKIALDGLNGVCWTDDSQIVDLRVTKRYGETPMLQIQISPLEIGLLERAAEVG